MFEDTQVSEILGRKLVRHRNSAIKSWHDLIDRWVGGWIGKCNQVLIPVICMDIDRWVVSFTENYM